MFLKGDWTAKASLRLMGEKFAEIQAKTNTNSLWLSVAIGDSKDEKDFYSITDSVFDFSLIKLPVIATVKSIDVKVNNASQEESKEELKKTIKAYKEDQEKDKKFKKIINEVYEITKIVNESKDVNKDSENQNKKHQKENIEVKEEL